MARSTTTTVDSAGVWFDGTVNIEDTRPSTVTFDAVRLEDANILGACPRPSRGTATVETEGTEAVVDFAAPGGGKVTVTVGKRVSTAVDLCRYASWLL